MIELSVWEISLILETERLVEAKQGNFSDIEAAMSVVRKSAFKRAGIDIGDPSGNPIDYRRVLVALHPTGVGAIHAIWSTCGDIINNKFYVHDIDNWPGCEWVEFISRKKTRTTESLKHGSQSLMPECSFDSEAEDFIKEWTKKIKGKGHKEDEIEFDPPPM